MKWFDNWLAKRIQNATLKEAEWWKQLDLIRPTASGQTVTVDASLKVSAVFGCVRIISEAIASLPLKIFERTAEGRREANHNLNDVFMLPNGIETGFEFREFMASSLALQGNSYNQKLTTRGGRVGEVVPLYPQHMHVTKKTNGDLVFDYQEPGANRVFSQSEIWRVAGPGSNGVTGLSPIGLARESIGLALALEEHGAKLFKNGTQTSAVFEMAGALSDQAYERLKEELKDHQGSGNAFKALLLENGISYKSVGMTAEDSQFIATRKLQVADIARFYRVPLHMLNELDKATFSNIEHQSIEFVRDTLTPWLVRIESSIHRDLLTESERKRYFAKHSVNALLRGDIKARFEAYGLSIRDGWMNRNEVRQLEDRNTEQGLDEFIMPLNMSTNDERTTQAQNAVIDDLISRETGVLAHDKNSDMMHFVNFYNRHLTKGAAMLGIDKKLLLPYGQKRLKEIEAGITDEYLARIMESGSDELRGFIQ